jgi:flagellar motility protein MotE (MotC chaperone)
MKMPRIRVPRLLPMTIGMLAIVLASKSVFLVRSAIINDQPAAFITAAWAAAPDAPKPVADKKPAATEAPTPKAEEKPSAPEPVAVSDSERAVLLELRERRKELEAREATLTARESMLAAAEKRLSSRVEELQGLQKKLESLDAGHRQQEDAAWQGLVKVYETMKPRDAAVIFNDLGMQVLLAVVGRMKEAKAAAILAAMAPDKARDVTTQLALSRTKGDTDLANGTKPALPPEPGKAPGSGT